MDDGQHYFTVQMEQQFLEIFGDKHVSTEKTDASKDRPTEHTTEEVRPQ
jgi:hypothetical protein